MARKYKYVFVSTIFGLIVWVIDTIADYLFFYQGNTFGGLLLFNIPKHELYIRFLILVAFIIFGAIINKVVRKKEKISQDLSASQENYRLVIEHAADGIVLHKMNGDIVEANETICKFLGYPKMEMLKLNIQDLDTEYKEREKGGSFWEGLSKKSMEMFRARQIRKDGSILNVEIKLTLVTINEEKMVISIVRDIEDRIKIEKEIKGHRDNLEGKIKERTKELEGKNKELLLKNNELERYNELFVGREFRIKELKDKILKLEGQQGSINKNGA